MMSVSCSVIEKKSHSLKNFHEMLALQIMADKDERLSLVQTLSSAVGVQHVPVELCQIIADFCEFQFKVGDLIDCKDPFRKWYLAEVLKVSPDVSKVFVHYLTWSSRWDEWIDISDDKISRIYSRESQDLDSVQVGDKVDWFTATKHIHECIVVEVTQTQFRLKNIEPSCKMMCWPYGGIFPTLKRTEDIKRVPNQKDLIIGLRK
jgi:hypothetical protein